MYTNQWLYEGMKYCEVTSIVKWPVSWMSDQVSIVIPKRQYHLALMYVHMYVYYIAGPGDIGVVNVACSPVDVINQCIVIWNVSYMLTYV